MRHWADSREDLDVLLALGEHYRLHSAVTTLISHDYKAKRSIAAEVTHLGINNLVADAMAMVAERLRAGLPPLDPDTLASGDVLLPESAPTQFPAELLNLAVDRGYGNIFTAQHSDTPWRPQLADDTGARLNPSEVNSHLVRQ